MFFFHHIVVLTEVSSVLRYTKDITPISAFSACFASKSPARQILSIGTSE